MPVMNVHALYTIIHVAFCYCAVGGNFNGTKSINWANCRSWLSVRFSWPYEHIYMCTICQMAIADQQIATSAWLVAPLIAIVDWNISYYEFARTTNTKKRQIAIIEMIIIVDWWVLVVPQSLYQHCKCAVLNLDESFFSPFHKLRNKHIR